MIQDPKLKLDEEKNYEEHIKFSIFLSLLIIVIVLVLVLGIIILLSNEGNIKLDTPTTTLILDGSWYDVYNTTVIITETEWKEVYIDDTIVVRYIHHYLNPLTNDGEGIIIAQNSVNNTWYPTKWNRIHYFQKQRCSWHFCTVYYNKNTKKEAETPPNHPELFNVDNISTGCGGFPMSILYSNNIMLTSC